MSEKYEQQNKLEGTWNSRQHKITAKDDEISQNLCLDSIRENSFIVIIKSNEIRKEAHLQTQGQRATWNRSGILGSPYLYTPAHQCTNNC